MPPFGQELTGSVSEKGEYKDQREFQIDMPLIIEVIDEPTKLEPLLPQIGGMVDDNGIVTLHEVDAI